MQLSHETQQTIMFLLTLASAGKHRAKDHKRYNRAALEFQTHMDPMPFEAALNECTVTTSLRDL